ncbi:hypothetical protein LCGC14_0574310 [marine sediment metagenome]|uniref:Major facilitator superfamily (MFS) profile domain-containing protein n=1 Tax=marine sediment metagenome TaxID=412755 RepID=A0A0F9RNB2_9ZZZZ
MINEFYKHSWRFWPIIVLSFIFGFSSPLIMIATPIYFFQQGVEIKFLGLLITAVTITYTFSPILLNKISDRVGRRKSVIISMVGASISQLLFYITLDPIVFLIERLFEGLILGFFFPNLMASISDNPTIDHHKYLARFNLSWSLALVFGTLFGAILSSFSSNLEFIFYISPIFLILNTIIAILFFQDPNIPNSEVLNINSTLNSNTSDPNQEEMEIRQYKIPVIIPLLLILAISMGSGNSSLLYPVRSAILGFPPSTTYLLNVIGTFSSSISMYLASLLAIKILKQISIITLFFYSFLFIFFIFSKDFFIFLTLFMLSGFFYGILYGTTSKLFMTLNLAKKTSKYSSISESSIGAFFFITQMFLGFIADIDIALGYVTLSLTILITFFVTLFFIRNMRETKITL